MYKIGKLFVFQWGFDLKILYYHLCFRRTFDSWSQQSMDVSLNKPFKTVLRRSWVEYAASVIEGFLDGNSDTSFKLPVLTRQHMIEWVKEGFDYLVQDQAMVKKFFRVCGISSLDPGEVRTVPFLNSVRERQCSIWRSMKLMILLSCTLHMLLWNP